MPRATTAVGDNEVALQKLADRLAHTVANLFSVDESPFFPLPLAFPNAYLEQGAQWSRDAGTSCRLLQVRSKRGLCTGIDRVLSPPDKLAAGGKRSCPALELRQLELGVAPPTELPQIKHQVSLTAHAASLEVGNHPHNVSILLPLACVSTGAVRVTKLN